MSDATYFDFGYDVPAPLAETWYDDAPLTSCDWGTIITAEGSNGWAIREQTGPDPSDAQNVDALPEIACIIDIFWSYHGVDRTQETGTELTVYAVVEFTDGRVGFVDAGNDYTGWGCQDGIDWWIGEPGWISQFGVTEDARRYLSWRGENGSPSAGESQ